MKTSIIIVTYNGMKWISKCLASIPTEFSVIVVDNNSTDGTVQFIHQNYPQFIIFEGKQNLGFGQANNRGISYALQQNADYVYLLNQDAYLEEDTIQKLINIHQQYPEYGILSPIHTNASQTKLDARFSNYVGFKYNSDFYSDFVLDNNKKEIYSVPFVNAAGWLLPKNTLLNVGGFDPIFFHYGEDDNYCQRVRYHNLKIGVVPNAFMVHDREDRKENKLSKGSKAYFKNKEKNLKVKYANINLNDFEKYDELLANCRNNMWKQFFLFKFKNAKWHRLVLKFLKSIKEEMRQSIEFNRKKGTWYLDS
ncbi:glycosyltransferase family 2 protein [Mesonia sp. K4-1]|uniref:glycosyltransferase family 2 protein n=1 Tax=Mesonia sp. K4-1 TaxID=2602760 RepID=UPI0011CB8306|nr:glycosyltransferase family 2 protein [Mesonia sp. K4-1]TXK72830.1 glycosyltransferase family 2 protein [Mesonia sp. K4-1]